MSRALAPNSGDWLASGPGRLYPLLRVPGADLRQTSAAVGVVEETNVFPLPEPKPCFHVLPVCNGVSAWTERSAVHRHISIQGTWCSGGLGHGAVGYSALSGAASFVKFVEFRY